MGIQRKSKGSLMELIEPQPGKDAPGGSIHPKLPPPPPKLPLPPSQPSLPLRPKPFDLKRKREQKGKDVVDVSRSRPSPEKEPQHPAKQPRTESGGPKISERRDNQPLEPQAWLPTPMINGEPLRNDAPIRDFHGGIGCQVASALDEALLLPTDMAELRSIRRLEVFLNLKRYLGMVVQATFRIEETTNSYYTQLNDKRSRRMAARDKAEKAKDEVVKAKGEAKKARDEAEQHGYDVGVTETEENLRAEVLAVCRTYCAQTWTEALNQVRVEASSDLRKPEKIYYPPTIRASDLPSIVGEVASTISDPVVEAQPQDPPRPHQQEQEKETEAPKETFFDMTTSSDKSVEIPQDGAASQIFEMVLASVTIPAKEDLRTKRRQLLLKQPIK
ncbi:uncharacterized protein LOC112012224 [Quercus suber]|uniref:uncharacterized protein LOC112012224 n=1 Tax=Quercus suber TaxID=58331 RepID=UPI000CE16ED2|nr:uncharacterized protein LOC112012224 [Quercus suber]